MSESSLIGLEPRADAKGTQANQFAVDWEAERGNEGSLVDTAGMATMIEHFDDFGFFRAVRTIKMVTLGGIDTAVNEIGPVVYQRPNVVPPLYRGALSGNENGMSWSDDYTEALWHANRRGGRVYACDFAPSDALAVLTFANPEGIVLPRARWAAGAREKRGLAASTSVSEWVMRPNGGAFRLVDEAAQLQFEVSVLKRNVSVMRAALDTAPGRDQRDSSTQ